MRSFALLLLFCINATYAQTLTGVVISVHDGDTLRVQPDCVCKTESIRLNGIDAPEVGTKGDLSGWQPYSSDARDLLTDMTSGKTVVIEWNKRDKYKRLVGTVYQDGKDINLRMIAAGAAWWFVKYKYDVPKDKRAAYAVAEQTARDARAGLWALPNPIAPWDWRKGVR